VIKLRHSFIKQTVYVGSRVVSEETGEELLVMVKVQDPTSLPNAVHPKHGCSNVHSLDTSFCRDHGAYGRPTGRIVLDHEVLDRHIAHRRQLSDQSSSNAVCHISLISVCLYDYSVMNLGCMLWVMFLTVVWMQAVSHISRDHEAPSDRPVVV
jgi:hypothetical protein